VETEALVRSLDLLRLNFKRRMETVCDT